MTDRAKIDIDGWGQSYAQARVNLRDAARKEAAAKADLDDATKAAEAAEAAMAAKLDAGMPSSELREEAVASGLAEAKRRVAAQAHEKATNATKATQRSVDESRENLVKLWREQLEPGWPQRGPDRNVTF